jgi:hypothetical protein
LSLSKDNLWEFVTRDSEGNIEDNIDIRDIQHSWKMRMQENTFDIGWNYFAHPNLRTALTPTNPDGKTWRAACDEEHDGLNNLNVFTEIATAEYNTYLKKHGDDARAIPTSKNYCSA